MYVHMTRSQLDLKRARCKISNKRYLSLNIWVIFYHSNWDPWGACAGKLYVDPPMLYVIVHGYLAYLAYIYGMSVQTLKDVVKVSIPKLLILSVYLPK